MASTDANNVSTPVSFPFPPPDSSNETSGANKSTTPPQRRSRTSTTASNASSRVRAASIKLLEAAPPPGMWAATGTVAAKAPTLSEIRGGSFGPSGWNEESQRYKYERRASQTEEGARRLPMRTSSTTAATPDSPSRFPPPVSPATLPPNDTEPFPAVTEEDMEAATSRDSSAATTTAPPPTYDGKGREDPESKEGLETADMKDTVPQRPANERQFSNGYIPPPKVPWTTSTAIGLKAFGKWFLTPAGFLITIYGLNVVAWGGMLFLLLCNAAPAMCKPSCNDIESPRRIWIEIDSQILNALFCVTGFGLAPWRFRDLYWWGWWRLGGTKRKQIGIRRLAGIHRGWFRLPGSDALSSDATAKTVNPEDPAVPIPMEKLPDTPPTGIHAPPTNSWKMDFVLWMNASNTFFQVVLCFYMWHYNRINRPSWATGLFVAMGCIVAGVGGIMIYHEGKLLKRVEGVPAPKGYEDREMDVESNRIEDGAKKSDGAAKS